MGKLAHLFLNSEFPVQWGVIPGQTTAGLDTEDDSLKWEISVSIKFRNHIIMGFLWDSYFPSGLISATGVGGKNSENTILR